MSRDGKWGPDREVGRKGCCEGGGGLEGGYRVPDFKLKKQIWFPSKLVLLHSKLPLFLPHLFPYSLVEFNDWN